MGLKLDQCSLDTHTDFSYFVTMHIFFGIEWQLKLRLISLSKIAIFSHFLQKLIKLYLLEWES